MMLLGANSKLNYRANRFLFARIGTQHSHFMSYGEIVLRLQTDNLGTRFCSDCYLQAEEQMHCQQIN